MTRSTETRRPHDQERKPNAHDGRAGGAKAAPGGAKTEAKKKQQSDRRTARLEFEYRGELLQVLRKKILDALKRGDATDRRQAMNDFSFGFDRLAALPAPHAMNFFQEFAELSDDETMLSATEGLAKRRGWYEVEIAALTRLADLAENGEKGILKAAEYRAMAAVAARRQGKLKIAAGFARRALELLPPGDDLADASRRVLYHAHDAHHRKNGGSGAPAADMLAIIQEALRHRPGSIPWKLARIRQRIRRKLGK
jgi:hypothetical protein